MLNLKERFEDLAFESMLSVAFAQNENEKEKVMKVLRVMKKYGLSHSKGFELMNEINNTLNEDFSDKKE